MKGDKEQYMGGGIYMSSDPKDSKKYGPFPVAFVIPAGTLYLNTDEKDYTKYYHVLNKTSALSIPEIKALGRIVPFLVHFVNADSKTSNVVYNAKLLQK